MKKGFLSAILFLLAILAVGVSSSAYAARPSVDPVNAQANQAGQLRSCEARQSTIQNRSTHLMTLASTMEATFDSIATRVEDYYTSKVVPSGKSVANYNALVADIGAKKNVVQTDLAKAQTDASNFSCTSSTPKVEMTQFRDDMQATKKALKDYRTAIKNLIVAVHSVKGGPTPTPGGSQ